MCIENNWQQEELKEATSWQEKRSFLETIFVYFDFCRTKTEYQYKLRYQIQRHSEEMQDLNGNAGIYLNKSANLSSTQVGLCVLVFDCR